MKRLVFVGLLMLGSNFSWGQTWCPPGAEWTYYGEQLGAGGQSGFTYARDTIVGGLQAEVIEYTYTIFEYNSFDVFQQFTNDPFYTSHQNNVLQLWSTELQEWDTIFMLNAVPGDRWQVAFTDCWGGELIEVVDTGTVQVDGQELHYWDYQQLYYSWDTTAIITRFTERIAGDRRWLPADFCLTSDVTYATRRCYRDDEMVVVNTEFEDRFSIPSCDFSTGAFTQYGDPGSAAIFPNPGSEQFTLSNLPSLNPIMLVDATGRVVLRQAITSNIATVDASALAPGIYTIRQVGTSTVRWIKH